MNIQFELLSLTLESIFIKVCSYVYLEVHPCIYVHMYLEYIFILVDIDAVP